MFSEHVRYLWHISEHYHARTGDLSSRNVLRDLARYGAIAKIDVASV